MDDSILKDSGNYTVGIIIIKGLGFYCIGNRGNYDQIILRFISCSKTSIHPSMSRGVALIWFAGKLEPNWMNLGVKPGTPRKTKTFSFVDNLAFPVSLTCVSLGFLLLLLDDEIQ